MISDSKFNLCLGLLQSHYNKQLGEDAIGIWQEYLDKELDDDQLVAATKQAIISCEFMPAPKKLVEFAVGSLQVKALEEWKLIVKLASYNEQHQDLSLLSPRSRIALQIVGGFHTIGYAEEYELGRLEKNFVAAYTQCSPDAKVLPPAKIQPIDFEPMEEVKVYPSSSSPDIQRILGIVEKKIMGENLTVIEQAINRFYFKWKWQIDQGRLEHYLSMSQEEIFNFGIQFDYAMKNKLDWKSPQFEFDKLTGYIAPPPKVNSRAIAKQWLQN